MRLIGDGPRALYHLSAARILEEESLLTTLDLLAAEITSQADVEENIATYLEMINAAASDDRDVHAPAPAWW